MWKDVIPSLESDYTLINIELRGHGESTATRPFTLWDLVDDWLAILDEESIDSAVLCGLSTGGMTAMRVAKQAPERVRALALLDTDALAEGPFNRLQYSLLGTGYVRFGILPKGALAKALFSPEVVRRGGEAVQALFDEVRRFDRRQLGHAMRAVFGRDRVDLSDVEVPTLVIVGEDDQALPPSRARVIAETIPGARLEVIPATGHLSAVENPEAVTALLRDFLAAHAVSESSR